MDTEAANRSGLWSATVSGLVETRRSLAAVFRNRSLRRVNLALAGSMVGDWAYATAVTVWAYGVGGATAVGVWGAVRLGLMAFSAPLGSTLADRFQRKHVMIATDLIRAVLVAAAALCLIWDAPDASIYVLATLAAVAGAPFRPAQMAIMPSLANDADELTASNGASSTIESLAFFAGPAIGALMLGVADVSTVFLLNGATFVVSALLVLGVRPAQPLSEAVHETVGVGADKAPEQGIWVTGIPATEEDDPASEMPASGFVAESLAGFRTIGSDRDLLMVAVLLCAQTLVAGASLVFTLVMAVDILGLQASGVGYLDSVLGVGAIVGGVVAIARGAKHKLAMDYGIAVMMWALPLTLVALWPSVVTVLIAMALLGLANPVVDVNYATILQRLTPDAVLGRVFGALEGALIGTMALGAFLMPFAIDWIGLRWSLAILGIGVALLVVPFLPRLRHLDSTLTPPAGLDVLKRIAIFGPLSPPVLETLARRLTSVTVPAGDVVLREGGESDRFFVIESGLVEVTQAGEVLRREGPGEFFGEIGLLRDVPRTATITAVEDTVLLAMDRDDFLRSVTRNQAARVAAEDVVSRRLTV